MDQKIHLRKQVYFCISEAVNKRVRKNIVSRHVYII